jgi:hypothetical protein
MKMMALTINDLPRNDVLDRAAQAELHGGLAPWIQNLIASVRTTVFTQNAVSLTIVNGPASGDVVNQITASPLSAASPMTFIQSA